MTRECFCCEATEPCRCNPKRCPLCGECLEHCQCPPRVEGLPPGVKP